MVARAAHFGADTGQGFLKHNYI